MTDTTTRERILDAGEALFAEEGFDGATLRRLTTSAGVNLAAVHYHFGSKEGLFTAVLERRVGPINEARLAKLDSLEHRDGPDPTVPELVEAFLGPMLAAHQDSAAVAFIRRLLGRFYTEQGGEWLPHFIEQFTEVKERFAVAFRRALPHLAPPEIAWRMHFALGAAAHALADEIRLAAISSGMCDPHDTETLMQELSQFIVGGLTAPSRAEGEGTT